MFEPVTKQDIGRVSNRSPGKLLKRKRQEHGWTVEDVANDLLLSVAQVKALEADNFDALPGATYVVGYWRNYASLVGINIFDAIEVHKRKIDTPSAAIALDPNHLRAHGHQEKSRKKSAFVFCFLSMIFLAGIWYWQNPADNPLNQWIENQSNRQLSIINSNSEADVGRSISSISDSHDGAQSNPDGGIVEIFANEDQESSNALPEPNFSEEFENSSARSHSNQEDDASVALLETQAGLSPDSKSSNVIIEESRIISVESMEPINRARDKELLSITEIDTRDQTDRNGSNQAVVAETVQEVDAELSLAAIQVVDRPEKSLDLNSPDWILFNIDKQTWLDVRDYRGEKLIYRTVSVGESLELQGNPPFYVFIGVADGVNVNYLGEPVEFTAHKSGLFARFKVGRRAD